MDIPATIIQLMANKMMAGLDGSQKESNRAIHSNETQTPQDDYIESTAPDESQEGTEPIEHG
jgi:hypothetical protein